MSSLKDLIDSAGRRVVIPVCEPAMYHGPFADVDFLSGKLDDERQPNTLWVYSQWTDRGGALIDSWILALSKEKAAGLVVVDERLPDASRLLAERLLFPVFLVQGQHLGLFLRRAFRLLASSEVEGMKRELSLIDATLDSWGENLTLEGFQHQLHSHGVQIKPARETTESGTRIVDWGRGSGERFYIHAPVASPRLIRLMELTIAVFLDRDAAEIESVLRHRSEFLLELLVDPRVPTGSVMRAASRFNLDLGRVHTALIWDMDKFSEYSRAAGSEQRILRTKGAVLEALEREARQTFGHGMVLPHSDEFVLIVESQERLLPDQALRGAEAIARSLTPTLKKWGVSGVTCGIGFPYDGPDGLRKSFEEAHEALTVGRARYGFGTIAHFKDLGLDRFLYGWLESPRSRELAEGLLAPVLAEPNGGELIETLRTYLDCMGRRSQAAQMLHIHRNTLTYRIQRLEQLLKLNLDDAAAQLVLQLALKARPELH
ncbi:CdaR family transcriptional regulator [Sulfobacillus sp. DSM 109850]|uniref:CdaR family transcriptional regulator n=2 Tax=Sulfobacillus harzensis TaxID=2729629 RepID=A0A7Y0Q3G7_9FIRM|nr:helix-turn-helix domain-containing protein [Sulfobacillus harzensis]NMP24228.1 CdaR family transcriptional regulator [Sulfobacillus harzensis]